jgi:hypothetical protein
LSNVNSGLGQGVQRSGLKNPQTAFIKGILSSLRLKSRFIQWPMSGIPDLDQFGKQWPSFVTFEL